MERIGGVPEVGERGVGAIGGPSAGEITSRIGSLRISQNSQSKATMPTRHHHPRPDAALLCALALAACVVLCSCAARRAPQGAARIARAHELYEEADKARRDRDFDDAERLYREALSLEEGIGGAWNNLGLVLKQKGNYLDAAAAFRRAAELLPDDARPLENLATVYDDRGFSKDALRYFGEALDRDPNRIESLRGAVKSAKLLMLSDELTLDRLNRAILIETDPRWLSIMMEHRLRVQQDIEERKKHQREQDAAVGG